MTPEEANNLSLRAQHKPEERQEALSKDLPEEACEQAVQNLKRY